MDEGMAEYVVEENPTVLQEKLKITKIKQSSLSLKH